MSIDNGLLPDVFVGDQVRVIVDDNHYALYTISEVRNEESTSFTRMGQQARARLHAGVPFAATLSAAVVAQGLTDEEAQAQNEFIERLVDNGSNTGLVVLAPHGGGIEPHTHKQAERVANILASKGVSSWICKGYKQGGGAYDRWHITSEDINCRSFPALNVIATRGFAYCVSFHGMSEPGITVGGGAPNQLRIMVRDAIAAAVDCGNVEVRVAAPDDPHRGTSPENVTNWLTSNGAGGIQIEQSLVVRERYWAVISDAIASVFEPLI